MTRLLAAVLFLALASPAFAQEVTEPKSGAKFAAKLDDTSLLGVGLRTKTMLNVKVYAIGLYVADAALSGPLHGKAGTPDLYHELLTGDFKKTVVMRFVRSVSTDQIRNAFRESLKGGGPQSEAWISYFTAIRSGQDCVISWLPGAGLQTKVAGVDQPPINDPAFAAAVFGIWLGDQPVQQDIKQALVSRAPDLLQ